MNENKLHWLIDGLMAIKILWPGTALAFWVDATASIFLRRHALRTYSRNSSDPTTEAQNTHSYTD